MKVTQNVGAGEHKVPAAPDKMEGGRSRFSPRWKLVAPYYYYGGRQGAERGEQHASGQAQGDGAGAGGGWGNQEEHRQLWSDLPACLWRLGAEHARVLRQDERMQSPLRRQLLVPPLLPFLADAATTLLLSLLSPPIFDFSSAAT